MVEVTIYKKRDKRYTETYHAKDVFAREWRKVSKRQRECFRVMNSVVGDVDPSGASKNENGKTQGADNSFHKFKYSK